MYNEGFTKCMVLEKRTCQRILVFLSTILCLLSPEFLNAQEGEAAKQPRYHVDGTYARNLARDAVDTVTSPLKWGRTDFATAAVVLGSGTLLLCFDKDIHSWSERHKTRTSEDAAIILSDLGHGGTAFGLMGAMYLTGELFGSLRLRKTSLLCIESALISGALVLGLKGITGRSRPHADEGRGTFDPFSGGTSFPSGHSQTAFSFASVIAEQSDSFIVDSLCYGAAGLIAASRVHKGSHWASDVLIGSALGYFIGKKICSLNEKRDRPSHVTVGLSCLPGYQGISVRFSF